MRYLLLISLVMGLPVWAAEKSYRCEPGWSGLDPSTNTTAPLVSCAPGTRFAMGYNVTGWFVRIECDKGEMVEVFFAPGTNAPYYHLVIDGAAQTIQERRRLEDGRGWRSLTGTVLISGGKESARFLQSRFVALTNEWRVGFTIPFDFFGEHAPLNGDVWRFNILRGLPDSQSMVNDDPASWWRIDWVKPNAITRTAIRKQMIRNAWRRYKDDLTELQVYWKLRGVDPEFYETKIAPLATADAIYERSNGKLIDLDKLTPPKVAEDFSLDSVKSAEETLNDLYARIPVWLEFQRRVDELRRDYLLDQLVMPGDQLRLVATPGEAVSLHDVAKLELKATDLTGDHGHIPSANIRLKTLGKNQSVITVQVPDKLAPGLYTGKLGPARTLTVRVLPFKLPQPKTYYDLNRDYDPAVTGNPAVAGPPSRLAAIVAHRVGGLIVLKADPVSAVESPELFRRNCGWLPYKAHYDGMAKIDDRAELREAIDDIRYATLLKTLAAKANESGSSAAKTLAKTALHWLEITDEKSADLDTMRLEMIRYILKLVDLDEAK